MKFFARLDLIKRLINFFRFIMGLIALMIIYPYRLKVTDRKHELLFVSAGLCGVTLYYLLENIALTFTMASNVGVICSLARFLHWPDFLFQNAKDGPCVL